MMENGKILIEKRGISNKFKYKILSVYALYMVFFGFLMDSPSQILKGLLDIIMKPDLLITDYISVGGMGAAFVNAGLLALAFTFMIYMLGVDVNGLAVVAISLAGGFALFGKNIFNVWFVLLGVLLYCKYKKEHFKNHVLIGILGTAMAPMVTQLMFTTGHGIMQRFLIGAAAGILSGFILPPLSSYLLRVHQGYNLYNVGFAAGVIGTVMVSIFKSYGFLPESRVIWSTGNNLILGIWLGIMFFSMLALGWWLNGRSFKGYFDIFQYSGRAVTDFVTLEGFGPTLINMGLLGYMSMAYILFIKGDFNGPTIGGIFTVVGFGAFGKHPKNVWPIFAGVWLGSVTKVWGANDPAIQLAALFGTTLAPIAGEFGPFIGIIAGFIHSSVVLNVGVLHGGMNLYNNGFAGGIVAAVMIPLIEAFGRRKENDS
ncbi:MAG TPA: DUF1576 domain-containing protein [Clostridia bacterium]|nr:DUF1576 domain-containing protein [Clostridia bacterium]